MRKYKNKLLLMIAFVFLFALVLATTAFCLEGEEISITFETALGINDTFDEIIAKGGDLITLPKGENTPNGYSYVWITADGRAYSGGTSVVFYESTILSPVYAYDVENAEAFYSICSKFDDSSFEKLEPNEIGTKFDIERYITIRLVSNITLDKAIDIKTSIGSRLNIILNGYTLTINEKVDGALGGERFATNIYGSGTIKYNGTGAIVKLNGYENSSTEENRLTIGRNVYIDASEAALAKDTSTTADSKNATVRIYGTVNCGAVLEVNNETERKPSIYIYTRAFVTIKDELTRGEKSVFTVSISGGTIVKESEKTFLNSANKYNITGGSFRGIEFKQLEAKLNGHIMLYKLGKVDNLQYGSVFPSSCGTTHTYTQIGTYAANCAHAKETIFKCNSCSLIYYISSGELVEHSFDEGQTTRVEALPTVRGEEITRCKQCGCEYYEFLYFNPLGLDVEVKVVLEEGKEPVSTTGKVEDIFDIDTETYVIKGIKDFGDYKATQVVVITVPAGVKGLNFASDNNTLKKIVLADGIEIEIASLTKLSALESIEIGAVVHAKFFKNCAPNSLKSIKQVKEGAKITFYDEAFSKKSSLQELELSKNSEYVFGSSSFKETGIKKLYLHDDSVVSFTGTGAFTGSALEELYLGKSIKRLDKKQFDSTAKLKKIILMEVSSIADGEFSNNATGECVVYHHTSSLTLGAKTFEKCNGITLYTTANVEAGFEGCETFTIIKGIKHAYELDKVDGEDPESEYTKSPTCAEEGYKMHITDCPCGVNEGTKTKVYSSVLTNSDKKESITDGKDYTDKLSIDKVPHNYKEAAVIRYFNGYTKEGSYAKECKDCKIVEPDEEHESCAPLVKSLGFSISEEKGATGGMVIKYMFNTQVIKEYLKDQSFEYGTVFAVKDLLGEKTPLEATSGVAKVDGNADGKLYASFSMKMANISEAQEKISFIMAAYIIENGKTTYIQENEIVDNPSGVTYKEVKMLSGL